jgi:hypothetical protein
MMFTYVLSFFYALGQMYHTLAFACKFTAMIPLAIHYGLSTYPDRARFGTTNFFDAPTQLVRQQCLCLFFE